ncbi:MAG: HAD family hydrolase [Lachnospiraceae bacterium]|nr:HAD family hydrolase [Lachnospiraceae bacterium]
MMYKHIVFDIDGTLVDNEKAILHSLQEVLLMTMGKEFSFEQLNFCMCIPGENTLERLGVEDVSGVMNLWIEALRRCENMVTIHKGIEELLIRLSDRGYRLGLASSRSRELLEKDFNKLKISKYFEIKVCADDTLEHKPTGAPLLKYMEFAGADKSEVLYIGDSVNDSMCAGDAGVDFALAVWGSHTEETPAKYYLRTPSDLLPILEDDDHQA